VDALYNYDDKTKEDEMGVEFGTHVKGVVAYI
jgi:hypothetical protein